MSVSKWRWTEDCDHGICVGECDKCDKALFEELEEGENNDEIEKRDDGDRIYLLTGFRKRLG